MSRIKARLDKLEAHTPGAYNAPLILRRIVSADGSSWPGPAISPGVGQIRIEDGESEADFLRRAHAMHAAKKLPSEMTDEEFAYALNLGDELNASDGPK